jgi:1-acyl-sn-glycerol-3-phosphate acyltransferase
MKTLKSSLLYTFTIYVVSLTTKLAFKNVYRYFKPNDTKMDIDYPTVIIANHVSETDIIALSHVFPKLNPSCKFHFAMRQDIIEPDFLVKEFSPKGLMKWILFLIDKTKIIRFLLLYIGGIGVKRPFRDDARKLMRDGELRDIVDAQWESLAEGCKKGRNLFLFPEGKFSQTGNLESIRKGVSILNGKIPNLSCTYVNFTYDYLQEGNPDLHIVFGEIFSLKNLNEKEIADLIKEKLINHYAITSGNFFSYILFQDCFKQGINFTSLQAYLSEFLNQLQSLTKKYFISEQLLKNQKSELQSFLNQAIQGKFILEKDNLFYSTEKLERVEFKSLRELQNKNPYLYHTNQLKNYRVEFDSIYTSISK